MLRRIKERKDGKEKKRVIEMEGEKKVSGRERERRGVRKNHRKTK